jgi:hypothetical protein
MVPCEENSTISIPVEFFGTEVEILIFPSNNMKTYQYSGSINDLFEKHLFSFDNYRINKDEANDYE